MSAYVPSDSRVIGGIAIILLVVLVGGYAIARTWSPRIARCVVWPTLVFGTLGVERLVEREPPGVRMLALIAFALLVMKVLVVIEERARGMAPLSFAAWLGFAGGWLGMNPRLFLAGEKREASNAGALIRRGLSCAALGFFVLILARLAFAHSRLVASALLILGLSLVVHFGVCNLLAGAWQLRGVGCEALFRAPLLSQNLSEFWARRWNLAFSEMTASAVYRPLSPRLGRAPALMAGFGLSGLLHEMAISVPVRAGFGLPFLYFVLHGGLVLVERALSKAGRPLEGWVGRAWAFFWLAAPLPILFHRPFMAGVIWPLIGG